MISCLEANLGAMAANGDDASLPLIKSPPVRLASWGIQVSPSCCICSTDAETKDHFLLT
ncbi:unnamed protein product, partial [Brassica rapa subsp. narinosa]